MRTFDVGNLIQRSYYLALILLITFGLFTGSVYAEANIVTKPSPIDIIHSAVAEGKLAYKLTEPEEVKKLLGPPMNEDTDKWEHVEFIFFDYPAGVQISFCRRRNQPVPFTLDSISVGDEEYDIGRERQIVLRDEDDLKKFDTKDFWKTPGGVSFVNLDLRGYKELLEEMRFDSRIKWPEPNKLPDGFDPARMLEEGKNPGLGIRSLHKQGVDGRGIGIAILDQVLLKDHVEYVDKIARYEEVKIYRELSAQMHGPPIVSIAVGKNCGVAPRAKVYYYAMMATQMPDNSIYCDIIDKIFEHNENADSSEQIRVVSISSGISSENPNFARWQETIKKADQLGIFVVTCGAKNYLNYGRLNHIPGKDPDDPNSYSHDRYRDGKTYSFMVPVGYKTTASHHGPQVYTFMNSSGNSWAAPYIAGLAALAFQVNPDVQPETIVEQLVKTATHAKAGPVVNPRGFIESIRPAAKKQ